jgi:pyridoxine 5'-phosphate synthase PdxJ
VPERREERTTEGGLEVAGDQNRLARFIGPLSDAGMRVSLFIAADPDQIAAAARIGALWWSCTPAPIAIFTSRAIKRPATQNLRA